VTGEPGFEEDMAQLHEKAKEKGPDNPSLRESAARLKEVLALSPLCAFPRLIASNTCSA
jgi:hypothetical protein